MAEKKGLWAHIERQAVPQKQKQSFYWVGGQALELIARAPVECFFYEGAALTDLSLGQQESWALSSGDCQPGDAVVVGS